LLTQDFVLGFHMSCLRHFQGTNRQKLQSTFSPRTTDQ